MSAVNPQTVADEAMRAAGLGVNGATAHQPLAFMDADEYLSAGPGPAVEWIWQGFLARGAVTLLSGPPKRGKSTLVWALVNAVRKGAASFLGRELAGGAVVYLTEEGRSSMRDKVSPGPGLRIVDRAAVFPRRPWPEVMEAAGAEAAAAGAALVVVDTLPWWANLGREAEKDSGRMQEALEPLLELAASVDVAVLIVHHDRKGGGEDGEAVRGSSAIAATVDCVIDLPRRPADEQPSGRRSLLAHSRWGDETPDALIFERRADGSLVALAVGDRESVGRRALHDKVLESFGDGEPSATEIAEAIGTSRQYVNRAITDLVKEGRLEQTQKHVGNKPARYRLVETSLWHSGVSTEATEAPSLLSPSPIGGDNNDSGDGVFSQPLATDARADPTAGDWPALIDEPAIGASADRHLPDEEVGARLATWETSGRQTPREPRDG